MEPGVSAAPDAGSTSSMIAAVRRRMAAGAEHLGHGALFLGEHTFHEGAVGAFLQGPFHLDLRHVPGEGGTLAITTQKSLMSHRHPRV